MRDRDVLGITVPRSTWCSVDLGYFRQNLAVLREIAGTRALLVVKADGYGHGLLPIAREAELSGISMLGVATIGEAVQLLDGPTDLPILVMCALNQEEIEFCVAKGIHFLGWRLDHFEVARVAAEKYDTAPLIHLEIDTGMSRSGVDSADLANLLDSLSRLSLTYVRGLATHFHSADLADLGPAKRQLLEYQRCVEALWSLGLRPLLHVANSPGTLRLPASRMDMVRLGVAAYGLEPSEDAPLPSGVKPILSWQAELTNVKVISAGRGVSYGWKYIADGPQQIGTIAVGYADGFRRYPAAVNSVLVGGVRRPVIGNVCMDQCVIRLDDITPSAPGEPVVLIGSQNGAVISAEEIAKTWGTNNYDVIAGIRQRVPRRYLNVAGENPADERDRR